MAAMQHLLSLNEQTLYGCLFKFCLTTPQRSGKQGDLRSEYPLYYLIFNRFITEIRFFKKNICAIIWRSYASLWGDWGRCQKRGHVSGGTGG